MEEIKATISGEAEVSAAFIEPTANGGGSATDVQINGTSITENGVANIPASENNTLGVARVSNYAHGLFVMEAEAHKGQLRVYQAENADISRRTDAYRPITPNNLDYAVTAVLTDGKAPALSDAQKQAAQSWLGIDAILGLVEAVSEVVG